MRRDEDVPEESEDFEEMTLPKRPISDDDEEVEEEEYEPNINLEEFE